MPFPVLHPKADVAGPAYNHESTPELNPALDYDGCQTPGLAAGDYEILATSTLKAAAAFNCSLVWARFGGAIFQRIPLFSMGAGAAGASQVLIPRVTVLDGDYWYINVDAAAVGLAQFSLMWRRIG